MSFEIIGNIKNIETLATGSRICELPRLIKVYGKGK